MAALEAVIAHVVVCDGEKVLYYKKPFVSNPDTGVGISSHLDQQGGLHDSATATAAASYSSAPHQAAAVDAAAAQQPGGRQAAAAADAAEMQTAATTAAGQLFPGHSQA